MKNQALETLKEKALTNNSIVKVFATPSHGKNEGKEELIRTFDSNEEAISYLKNIAFKNRGICEQLEGKFEVTTENKLYQAILIKL